MMTKLAPKSVGRNLLRQTFLCTHIYPMKLHLYYGENRMKITHKRFFTQTTNNMTDDNNDTKKIPNSPVNSTYGDYFRQKYSAIGDDLGFILDQFEKRRYN